MALTLWFFLLMVQNAAFTWVSRARNSGSYAYHAVAAVFSNGVFFVSQFFMIGMVAKPGMPLSEAMTLGAIYIAGTVIGSVAMHYASINWLESGKRRVGA